MADAPNPPRPAPPKPTPPRIAKANGHDARQPAAVAHRTLKGN